jgi:hypothetical protein
MWHVYIHKIFRWGNLRERDHFEDLIVDGRIRLKWILKTWDGVIYWVAVAQDRDRCWALVNAVMNLRVSQNAWSFLTS